MKKSILSFLMMGCMLLGSQMLSAQSTPEKPEKPNKSPRPGEEEEEGPSIFKFEPTYMMSVEAKRERLRRTRSMLDTMDISERKRRKLLKDLYKNGMTEQLQKILVTETKFEDEIDD